MTKLAIVFTFLWILTFASAQGTRFLSQEKSVKSEVRSDEHDGGSVDREDVDRTTTELKTYSSSENEPSLAKLENAENLENEESYVNGEAVEGTVDDYLGENIEYEGFINEEFVENLEVIINEEFAENIELIINEEFAENFETLINEEYYTENLEALIFEESIENMELIINEEFAENLEVIINEEFGENLEVIINEEFGENLELIINEEFAENTEEFVSGIVIKNLEKYTIVDHETPSASGNIPVEVTSSASTIPKVEEATEEVNPSDSTEDFVDGIVIEDLEKFTIVDSEIPSDSETIPDDVKVTDPNANTIPDEVKLPAPNAAELETAAAEIHPPTLAP